MWFFIAVFTNTIYYVKRTPRLNHVFDKWLSGSTTPISVSCLMPSCIQHIRLCYVHMANLFFLFQYAFTFNNSTTHCGFCCCFTVIKCDRAHTHRMALSEKFAERIKLCTSIAVHSHCQKHAIPWKLDTRAIGHNPEATLSAVCPQILASQLRTKISAKCAIENVYDDLLYLMGMTWAMRVFVILWTAWNNVHTFGIVWKCIMSGLRLVQCGRRKGKRGNPISRIFSVLQSYIGCRFYDNSKDSYLIFKSIEI